jgi:Rrf2 family protein
MRLSRSVAYALQATLQLARANAVGVTVPCSRLAADGGMPERFLLQILRNLVTHGILHSTRGVDGGYALLRSPAEISLLDLIEAVDGPVVPTLSLHDGLFDQSREKLVTALTGFAEVVRRELRAIKLSHLLPA